MNRKQQSSRSKSARRNTTQKRYLKNKSSKKRGKGAKNHYSRKHKDGKLTRENWMKKLIFKGGSGAAEHGVSVFGGMDNQHVGNGGAIHVNQLQNTQTLPIVDGGANVDPAVQVQSGGKKRKTKRH
jgi:hypothetical protein